MTSLEDFKVIEIIGQGSYSTVYKVERKADSQLYAMKRIKIWNLKPKEKMNSLNEIWLLASIQHPNIVSYKEAFIDEES